MLGIYVYYLLLLAVIIFAFVVHAAVPIIVHLHLVLLMLLIEALVLVLLVFVHIFGLLFILKILLIVILLIYSLHILRLRHLTLSVHHAIWHLSHPLNALSPHRHHHTRGLAIHLHHATLDLLLQPVRSQTLMPWRAEWSDLLLAAKLRWQYLAIVITSEVTIGCLAREHPLASLALAEVADCPLVAFLVVGGEGFRAGGLGAQAAEGTTRTDPDTLQSRIIRTNTIEEVGIATEAIAVLSDHVLQLLLLLEVMFPLAVVVVGSRVLQLIQQDLVLIDNAGQAPDPVGTVKGCVRVQSVRLVFTPGFPRLRSHQSLPIDR